jgi:hypothetical protein
MNGPHRQRRHERADQQSPARHRRDHSKDEPLDGRPDARINQRDDLDHHDEHPKHRPPRFPARRAACERLKRKRQLRTSSEPPFATRL